MVRKSLTWAVVGLEGAIVEVEADIAQGLPYLGIVGPPDTGVRRRIRAAFKNTDRVLSPRALRHTARHAGLFGGCR